MLRSAGSRVVLVIAGLLHVAAFFLIMATVRSLAPLRWRRGISRRDCGVATRRAATTLRCNMVANAHISSARAQSRAGQRAEERELEKLNRMFAKAAPLAARKRVKALKRLRDDIAAQIRRAS